jgi:ribosomal protein S18 acetylase RimI-like enzyme
MVSLDVAWAFEITLQDRCAARIEAFDYGSALFRPDLPRVYDENFLRLERGFGELDARDLAAVADRLQGAAGLAHRKAIVPDEAAGQRLSRGFSRLRWRRSVLLTMGHDGEPVSEPAHEVVEPDPSALTDARVRAFADDLGSGAAAQVAGHLELVASVVDSRAFAVVLDGETVSWCVLYSEDGVGQIDDVVTAMAHRRKGYARSVVQAAVRASQAAGNEFTFLVADDDDWPKEMYARLGFEPLGRRYEFTRA